MKLLKLSLIVFCMLAVPLAALDYISAADKGHLPWWLVIGFMMMLPLWYYVLVKELKQLVFVLPLFLCVSAYAAPLPPFPTVKRPAPLLSPKAASAPKTTPMVKATTFTPAGYTVPGLAPIWVSFTKDFNFFHCDTNKPPCELYDITKVQAKLRAGRGLRIEYVDALLATGGWAFAAEYGSCVSDCVVGFTWFHSVNQRLAMRVFRAVEIETMTPASARSGATVPTIRVNPDLKGLAAWSACGGSGN